MDWLLGLDAPQAALAVMTAMITPAVLISACGALIFSTSARMGRVVDRVRELTSRFEALAKDPDQDEMFEERRALIFMQLDRLTVRARLLQRALLAFYVALSIFLATSLAIAVIAVVAVNYTWIAVVLGLTGSGLMFYSSVLLVLEARMALFAIMSEMDFVWKVSRKYAGDKLAVETSLDPLTWLGRKMS